MASAPAISLRHLKAFLSVADAGSITAAAAALYRAESAVSRSIKELERVLVVPLFDRTASGMALTAYGKALLARARAASLEFALAREALSPRAAGPGAPVFEMLFSEHRLAIFIALAETRHMPSAAKLTGVSQPAVSAAIGDLESSLGFALFLRTARGMLPTEQGQVLLFRTKRAFAELRHVPADIAGLQGHLVGEIVVGSHPVSRAFILPAAIARVLVLHPQLKVRTVEGPSADLIAGVRTGDLDLVLNTLREGPSAPDLSDEPLTIERMAVFVRAGHPLAARPSVTAADLAQCGWILPSARTPTRQLFDAAFRQMSGALPRSAVETSDLLVLRGLLLTSDLVTAISPQQLDFELRSGQVRQLDVALPRSDRVISLTQRAKSEPSPGARALIGAIRQVVKETQALELVHRGLPR